VTVLSNNFNGGPSATTISTANSGQFDDDAFDVVASGSSTLQFINNDVFGVGRPTAEFVMNNSAGIAGTPYVEWNTAMGSLAEVWTRFYVYPLNSVPSSSNRGLFSLIHTNAPLSVGVWMRLVSTPRSLLIIDSAGATVAMTTPLSAGAWSRIEFHAQQGGTADLRLYAGVDADTDNITESISQTGASYGASPFTKYQLGQRVTSAASIPTALFSNWAVSSTGYLGPAPFRQGLGNPAGNLTTPSAIHVAVN
jgi:hypothetical protein